jgi:hypothetical protein
MLANSASYIPIDTADLAPYLEKASRRLAQVKHTPKINMAKGEEPSDGSPRWRESTMGSATADTLSLMSTAKKLSRDPLLLSDAINHAMTTVRRGLQIGMHLSALYTQHSGLENLIHLNERGGLTGDHLTEFREKYKTAAAITMFTSSYYILWELVNYRSEDISNVNLEYDGIPELSLNSPVHAINCMVYYYAAYLEKSGLVHNDLELLKLTTLYFQGIIDEIRNRLGSLRYTDTFTSRDYKLNDSDFAISGFDVHLNDSGANVVFNRVDLEMIVGNRDAKHKARRLAERLLCYDAKAHANPMQDMGGLPHIRAGFGKPGTGKSMQIAATATLMADRCMDCTGLPFYFNPLPDNIISTFQGGSGERMVTWFKPFHDPNKIVYGPIDDGEQNLEDRTRQGVSSGVREVISVYLRYTEGAYAVWRGNAAIEIFTNLPDQIDKAVLSRILDRFRIDGAETWRDFIDQDYLWWNKGYHEIDPEFVDSAAPDDYEWLADQRALKNMAEHREAVGDEPGSEQFRQILKTVEKDDAPDSHTYFAKLYEQVQKAFNYFSSRDVRNIQRAVDERILDFDFPQDWFDNPTLFYRKGYDEKKNMLIELMTSNMKGLSLSEIRRQEAIRYIDTMIQINQGGRERKISEMVERMDLEREAAKRVVTTDGDV